VYTKTSVWDSEKWYWAYGIRNLPTLDIMGIGHIEEWLYW